ncbi:MAG: hypothetical protein L3J47_08555 [Sulfurovum sp.]|nr:hypothetical protein [Sulfurovum sp.]
MLDNTRSEVDGNRQTKEGIGEGMTVEKRDHTVVEIVRCNIAYYDLSEI